MNYIISENIDRLLTKEDKELIKKLRSLGKFLEKTSSKRNLRLFFSTYRLTTIIDYDNQDYFVEEFDEISGDCGEVDYDGEDIKLTESLEELLEEEGGEE